MFAISVLDKLAFIAGYEEDGPYRCEGHARRGVCTNSLSVRESVVRAGLPDELCRRLTSDRGAQLDFPTQQLQGVAEVWVPFEGSVAVRW